MTAFRVRSSISILSLTFFVIFLLTSGCGCGEDDNGPKAKDHLKPYVAIASPADGSTVPLSAAISIIAFANDNEGVEEAEFFVDGVSVGTDSTAPYTGNWSVGVMGGYHTVEALAADAEGNIGFSNIAIVEVNWP